MKSKSDPLAAYITKIKTGGLTNQMLPSNDRQVQNHEGGYVFGVDLQTQFRRFLILGSASGSYYVGKGQLTKESIVMMKQYLLEYPYDYLRQVTIVAQNRLAPKVDQTLFALSLACCDERLEIRNAAWDRIPVVVNTGSHFLQFVQYIQNQRSFGRGMKRALIKWYDLHSDKGDLEYQMLKYQGRYGWTQRDVLRMLKPKPTSDSQSDVFKFVAKGQLTVRDKEVNKLCNDMMCLRNDVNLEEVMLVVRNGNVSWEMLPTKFLADKTVWKELINNGRVPMNAWLRNLGRLTANGTIPQGLLLQHEYLLNYFREDYIVKSRIHPFAVLLAANQYKQGKGDKGKLTWYPNGAILDGLDEMFKVAASKNLEHIDAKVCVSFDVSPSMWGTELMGTKINAAMACAAMGIVHMNSINHCETNAFTDTYTPFHLSKNNSISSAMDLLSTVRNHWGGTDCAVPIKFAYAHGLLYDAFIVYTDNETHGGQGHVNEWLKKYRDRFNSKAKLIVVAMTSTNFSINDPTDKYGLDVVGFDASTPQVINQFIRGEI